MMRLGKLGLVSMCAVYAFGAWSPVWAAERATGDDDRPSYGMMKPRGLEPVRNLMPLYMLFLQMPPESARSQAPVGGWTFDIEYQVSNSIVDGFTPATEFYNIVIDAEVTRASVDVRHRVNDRLEVGIEVPVVVLGPGYLDSFVESFEDAVGANTPRSRKERSRDNYTYKFRRNGVFLIETADSSVGLGDVELKAKFTIVEEGDAMPHVAVRGALKLPTADSSKLLGGGQVDGGIGLAFDKQLHRRVHSSANINALLIGDPDPLESLDLDTVMFSWALGFEVFPTNNFSFLTQVSGSSTPFPGDSDTAVLENAPIDATFAFAYAFTPDVVWDFSVVENIQSQASPDVSFRTAVTIRK